METPIQGPTPELLKVIVCPKDKGALACNADDQTLTCQVCGKVYRIEKGVPNLLP